MRGLSPTGAPRSCSPTKTLGCTYLFYSARLYHTNSTYAETLSCRRILAFQRTVVRGLIEQELTEKRRKSLSLLPPPSSFIRSLPCIQFLANLPQLRAM